MGFIKKLVSNEHLDQLQSKVSQQLQSYLSYAQDFTKMENGLRALVSHRQVLMS